MMASRSFAGPWGDRHHVRAGWPYLLMALMVFMITGCATVGPDYAPPDLDLPEGWHTEAVSPGGGNPDRLARWWQSMADPVLSRLIEAAQAGNLDVQDAISRVRQARLSRAITNGGRFPTLDASASASLSGNDSSDTSEWYTVGFDAGWEIDLFGGTRRALEAADADIAAEAADFDDVLVTLFAEVAVNYIDLRAYQARLSVARRNVRSMEETWSLLDSMANAGMGGELTTAQARYNLYSARAKIPDLDAGLAESMHRLAVLSGRPAGALDDMLAKVQPMPKAPSQLAMGVPADLLRQRPDIRKAERQLAAQTARIGEAEADLYPSLRLSGSIGLEALSLGDLFSAGSRIWSIGPSISLPLFNAAALRNQVDVERELQQQALIAYQQTVLEALEEVENALVALDCEKQKQIRLASAARSARQAADIAKAQYATGMTGFSDVLDAQRS